MDKSVTVEVIIDNFKDNKYFNQELEIVRRGNKTKIIQKLLQKGDKYETDIEHAEYLEKANVVKITKKEKNNPSIDDIDLN